MKQPQSTTLQGEHVQLVPLTLDHAPELYEAGQYDEVWTWLPWPRPRTVDDMITQISHATDDPTRIAFAVVVDGRAIGTTSYMDIDLSVEGLEIGGTWYTPAVWATKVNPESKLLLMSHAFDELGAARVLWKTDALNARSRAAISKLGAKYDGTLRHHRLRGDGTVRDSAYFSMLAPEWPAARDRLVARLASA